MKYPHSIPLWRTNEELLSGNAPSRVVLSSAGTKWNDVVVEQHHFPNSELAGVIILGQSIAAACHRFVTTIFRHSLAPSGTYSAYDPV
jgi:hypothetical protein